jgi:hypothetical protein
MNRKNVTLALLVVLTGLAAASQAHAGQGSVMLGSTAFADRCQDNGGQLFGTKGGYACQLPATLLECTFAGAHASCAWNGVQNKLEVVRVIGLIGTDSLSSVGSGGFKKPGGGGVVPLDLPIKN